MPLPGRKALAARLVQIEATLPLEDDFRRHAAHIAYNEIDRELVKIFEREKALLDDYDVHLDKSLRDFLTFLELSAKSELVRHRKLLRDWQFALSNRAGLMACDKCSYIPETVCDGGVHDNALVSRGGACIAPLKEMFDIAHDLSRLYYSSCGTLMTSNPEVVFTTKYYNGKPHDFPVDYFVGGLTSYADNSSATRARVAILLPAELFNTSAYLSALYALFHECIVHAFHAITPRLKKRIGPLAEDRFLEGWMDWVASEVLDQVLDGNGLGSLPSTFGFRRQRREHARAFHAAKTETATTRGLTPSKLAPDLSIGRSSAIKVLEVLRNHPGECPDPWRKFLQLSFDLNMMSDFDQEKREAFVTTLFFLDEDDRQSNPSPRHCVLTAEISKYLRHNSLRDLIDSILSLNAKWLSN